MCSSDLAPRHAIWVNALLFASLCLDIVTTILALMIWEEVSTIIYFIESPHYNPQYWARVRERIVSEMMRSVGYSAQELMIFFCLWSFFLGLSIGIFVCCAGLGWITHTFTVHWLHKVGVCSFVVYMRIKPNSSFGMKLKPRRRIPLASSRQTQVKSQQTWPMSRLPVVSLHRRHIPPRPLNRLALLLSKATAVLVLHRWWLLLPLPQQTMLPTPSLQSNIPSNTTLAAYLPR